MVRYPALIGLSLALGSLACSARVPVAPGNSDLWQEDYGTAPVGLQGLFVHEMTHVWQSQLRGKYYLPLMRHPFCRYRYELEEGRAFVEYGLEQQAEIVRHVWMWRMGRKPLGAPPLEDLEPLLPFGPESGSRG